MVSRRREAPPQPTGSGPSGSDRRSRGIPREQPTGLARLHRAPERENEKINGGKNKCRQQKGPDLSTRASKPVLVQNYLKGPYYLR